LEPRSEKRTRIASSSVDMTVRVWDAGTGKQVGDPNTC
jgi:hypothetical protein